MISTLLIHPNLEIRRQEAEKILAGESFSRSHPDLLFLGEEEKLGIEMVKKIQEFLSLKPYQGNQHALVLLAAENLTRDAQNALLKTLEEPVGETIIILGAASEEQLLPTIISRCHVVNLQTTQTPATALTPAWEEKIQKLQQASIEERFKFVEKQTDKEKFLGLLTSYFHTQLRQDGNFQGGSKFMYELIQSEKWAKQNVNIRAILEYLMLKLPQG